MHIYNFIVFTKKKYFLRNKIELGEASLQKQNEYSSFPNILMITIYSTLSDAYRTYRSNKENVYL